MHRPTPSSRTRRLLVYFALAAALFTLCFEYWAPANRAITPRDDYVEPERYELCKTDAEIQALQQKYSLIMVSSTPTKAAMHPGWPETMISLLLSCATIAVTANKELRLLRRGNRHERRSVRFRHTASRTERILAIVYAVLLIILGFAWTVSFALIVRERDTGGWISVLAWTSTGVYLASLASLDNTLNDIFAIILVFLAILLVMFQWCGSIAVVVQRWKGEIGTIAYIIKSHNGCIPYNGFEFLQQGARGRQFRIIQTAELLWACVFVFFQTQEAREETVEPIAEEESRSFGCVVAMFLFLMYVPILVYEIIIASLGRPVVISGNCMLVELDPRFGFLDSEIETWWKVLIGITGF